MKTTKEQAEKARAALTKLLKPGDTVYCVLRNVARSGTFRRIDFYHIGADGPTYISGYMADLGVGSESRGKSGLGFSGCGMDMGFAAVHDLGRTIFGSGFECTGEDCPSSDHANGDRDRKPHTHPEGGYALRHAWL